MNFKFVATAAFAFGLALTGLSAAASAATVDTAYIGADGTVQAGNAVSATLTGVQYDVKFTRIAPGFCAPHVQPNIGQPAMATARVVSGAPLTVSVILTDGSGAAIVGPDFYLTVVCTAK